MRGSVSDDADVMAVVFHHFRFGNNLARTLKLVPQTIKIVLVVVWPFTVLALLVVSRTAREPSALRMIDPRQGAITNAIAVDIFVSCETTEPVKILFGE